MAALAGKVAIVTGSGSGIGQAIAERLAKDGANLAIDYIGNPAGAQETLKAIEAAGGKGRMIEADISKVADAARLVEETVQAFGSVDILVNNAGVEKEAAFWDVTEADYDFVLNVNLKGAFFLTQAFVRALLTMKKGGRVINISSVHEDMAFPNFASYCASKGGVRMLMRDLAVELGPKGITVNNVAPGAIITPINKGLLADTQKVTKLLSHIPLGRLGSTSDVSSLVAFLASDEAAYINGATLVVDGGLMRNYHEQ